MPIVQIALEGRPRAGILTLGVRGADLRASLEGGLPLRDGAVDEVFAGSALAHVRDFVGALEELWRIGKPGALLHLRLPHASSPWATSRDPRHPRQYTIETFDFFSPQRAASGDCPTRAAFEIERARLHLTPRSGPDRGRGLAQGTVARLLEAMANRNRGMQYRWERWLGHFIGFDEMSISLSVVKPRTPAAPPAGARALARRRRKAAAGGDRP